MIRRMVVILPLLILPWSPAAGAELAFNRPACPATMTCRGADLPHSNIPPKMSTVSTATVPDVCVRDVMGNLEPEHKTLCEAFAAGTAGTPRERATALVNLGHLYTRIPESMLKPAVAMAAWDKAIAVDPTFAEPHAIKGDVAARKRKYEEAILAFDRALALDSGYWRAMMGKARIFLRHGQTKEALALARKAVVAASAVSIVHQLHGEILLDAGMLELALSEFQIAADLDKGELRRLPGLIQEASPWSRIAHVAMRLGQVDRAITAVSREIDGKRVQNVDPSLFLQRAEYLEAAGRLGAAADDYEKAMIGFGPGFDGAEKYRARIAMLRASTGRSAAAGETFRDLLRKGNLKSILRIQVFLKNQGFDAIEIDGKRSATLEKALDRCLSDPDCSLSMGQSI